MKNQNHLWHPNTQMLEWTKFPKIVRGEGMWLIDEDGNRLLDGVASMWCNVWGHSKKELVNAIIKQTKKLQHASLFNLTNEPSELLAKKLINISPNMDQVFFSDNGSTAMEIAIKIALQYWTNLGFSNKNKIATLENGYHGDTFGAMSIGYVPEFFSKFKSKLFSTLQFEVPRSYNLPKNVTEKEFENDCIKKIENKLSNDNSVAAFVMESGAQVAGGVNIYPKNFQKRVNTICKKYNVLFVLDEIDKLSNSNQGDPSSAMLEVLEPEQNGEFYDIFLEIGFDLSKVNFIATYQSLSSIQPALLDRMEIIEMSGYTVEEKVSIAKKHLLPKQLKEHGLGSKDLQLPNKVLEKIVDGYTRESGVRGLEKVISKVIRFAAKCIAIWFAFKIFFSPKAC